MFFTEVYEFESTMFLLKVYKKLNLYYVCKLLCNRIKGQLLNLSSAVNRVWEGNHLPSA